MAVTTPFSYFVKCAFNTLPPLFQPQVDRAAVRPAVLELAEAPRLSVALRWVLSWRRRASSSLIQLLKLHPSASPKTSGFTRVDLLDLAGIQLPRSPIFPSVRFSLLAQIKL